MKYAEPIISIKGVTVCYDNDVLALDNVSLDIFGDDFLGVIGPNGGGKTSLIKAILGLVDFNGKISFSESLVSSRHSHKIGYLPQINSFDRLFPISVIEVVMSGMQKERQGFRRYTAKERQLAAELLDMMGVKGVANRSIGELSGGQVQRVLLCRALISDPKLLILDEPANFVDSDFEKELYEILKQLNEKLAIVMISHDLGTITSVVKNIVCVNKHVHRHNSNLITPEQLHNYNCPIQLVYHADIPHTVLPCH